MATLSAPATLLGRIMLAAIFLQSGWGKIGGYAGTQGYMEKFGVSGQLLPLVIAVELVGGILLVVGWMTRWAALALAGFTLIAALYFHTDFADRMQIIHFMKNLAITGGLLVLFGQGPGRWSIDRG
jgi:putative oxidoreductase